MDHKKGQLGKQNTNLRIMMTSFFTGIRLIEMIDVVNVLDLDNAINIDCTLLQYHSEIGNAIIKILKREIQIVMAEEMRCTIVTVKGDEYHKKWSYLPLQKNGPNYFV